MANSAAVRKIVVRSSVRCLKEVHMIPRFFTFDEISEITHAPPTTVRYWAYSGQLRSRKIGRRRLVTEDELRHFLGLLTREDPHSRRAK